MFRTWFLMILMGGSISGLLSCGLSVTQIPKGKHLSERPQNHFITINGVRFHYERYPGEAQPIFLLHGFGSSTYTWEKVIPYLTDAGYPVWTLDMKGFGWSEKPENAAYDAYTLMEEVSRWMDAVGLSQVVFVGNSLGGAIGWLMALEHPGKVGRLVLVDAAGYPMEKPFPLNMAQVPLASAVVKLLFSRILVKWTLEKVYYHDDWVTDTQVNAYFDRLRTGNGLDAQLAVARALDANPFEPYIDRIPSIEKETLLVWGENDDWIPLDEVGRRFERELPHGHLKVIPACGHIPQEEYPKETAQLIIDFIQSPPE